MKYSINSAGRIVAERDIYSLGGFIPKGRLGGFIADETQLSQDGECWLSSGDISTRPDVRIKDNAYIGNFIASDNPVHTDGVTEFSGNTLIPGSVSIRCFAADTKNNMFVKDSFIGVSMDVLCGPSTTATAFPFEQGDFKAEAAKGTLFTSASMRLYDTSACRNTATLRPGRNTYLYIPTGYRARVFWAYYDNSNQLAYSGESTAIQAGLIKLNRSVYRLAMVSIVKADGTAMTPTDLLATGAKILGHISSSVLTDIRPESVSGEYAMVNSSFIAETDNFGLAATQKRFLAGSMYDTTMYTKTDRPDYKLYGTFRNVERLEYTKYLGDSHRTAATRDTYISAYDCPLLRVDDDTYDDSLASTGDLVLRRCIVPKASFTHDVVNGNTYEDIDFSYANEDLGFTMAGYTRFISSHKQGIYRLSGGSSPLGFASHKGNLADTARLFQAEEYIPLDGDLVESGSYSDLPGTDYEDAKIAASNRVRMARPLATFGAIFPSMPTGYAVNAIIYLDPSFIITSVVSNPTSISTDDPYFILVFRKGDGNIPLPVNEFIALNRTLRIIDSTKVPEITGSAYVGAGCTVRGDVKLIGDPYVNRVFDVNMWERGNCQPTQGGKWQDGFFSSTAHNRYRSKDLIPVEPGGTVSRTTGGKMVAWFFDEFGNRTDSSGTGWVTSFVVPTNVYFVGIVLEKTGGDALLTEDDIAISGIKYVRAFKKRRYIVNELDRTSPKDILLDADMWEQGYLDRIVGKTYETLKSASSAYVRLRRPVNTGKGAVSSHGGGFGNKDVSFDAITKCVTADDTIVDGTPLYGTTVYKAPSAAITPSEIANSRLVLEFVPQPRIIVPYGSATLFISGPKIRMYDNTVLSRNLNQEGVIVLQGDAVMGYDFNSGPCMCSNDHSDAIIKLP